MKYYAGRAVVGSEITLIGTDQHNIIIGDDDRRAQVHKYTANQVQPTNQTEPTNEEYLPLLGSYCWFVLIYHSQSEGGGGGGLNFNGIHLLLPGTDLAN